MTDYRSYADYVDEISSDELLGGLLGYGLFDEKLPPLFTSVGFCDYFLASGNSFSRGPKGYMTYQCIRHNGGMRVMGIPHPVAYARLCECLAEHWGEVSEKLKANTAGQDHKISRIHLRHNDDGPLFRMSYSSWDRDGDPILRLQVGSRYQVDSDIAQCFPSIYTHAVSWALVGKAEAKEYRNDKCKWYNELDYALRNCKEGETHGIHIGPHASNLIAEIILTAVDAELAKTSEAFIRNVDDFQCFAKTFDAAEAFVRNLDQALSNFGLLRNQAKTAIRALPLPTQNEWPRALKGVPLPTDGAIGRGAALSLLDRAVDLMRENGENAAVLNYALKMLDKTRLTPQAREAVIERSLHFARIFPYLLPILEASVFHSCGVARDDVAKLSRDLWGFAKKTRSWFPAYYAFYYALRYGFSLSIATVDEVLESKDPILMTCEYAYAKARRNSPALTKLREYARGIVSSCDEDANWLFVYEALPAKYLHDEFAAMKRAGVSFLRELT